MKSMTGYGRGEAGSSALCCVVECASVNRKGLEVACQLPRELSSLEISIRDHVARHVARGRVNVSVALSSSQTAAPVELDHALARSLASGIESLRAELGLSGSLDINTLVSLPGVIHSAQHSSDAIEPLIHAALEPALHALVEMRTTEGENLRRDLSTRLETLRANREQMSRLAPEVVTRYRTELFARIERAGIPVPLDDSRLLTEIALFAERCDISEELTRLESHYGQFASKLESEGSIGRALEFLTQEIYRELNTLGSKAGDSALTSLVVDSKVELDKIREQVLNVE